MAAQGVMSAGVAGRRVGWGAIVGLLMVVGLVWCKGCWEMNVGDKIGWYWN